MEDSSEMEAGVVLALALVLSFFLLSCYEISTLLFYAAWPTLCCIMHQHAAVVPCKKISFPLLIAVLICTFNRGCFVLFCFFLSCRCNQENGRLSELCCS